MQFALTYASNAYDFRTKIMGRQSAGLGFLRAALAARPERIWCYAETRAHAVHFGQDVKALAPDHFPEIRFIPWDDPGKLTQAGLLYRPDPGIGQAGWHRQVHAAARAYSICGVTHTLSSHSAMSAMTELLRAPLYSWDAVICTSTVARDLYRTLLEAEIDHLAARLGASRFPLPQLPVIPLGVHAKDFEFEPSDRAAARAQLDIGPEEVAVLFAGRLTFTGKGHPLPMYLGLEAAAERTGCPIRLVLFGQFPHEKVEQAFRDEAARFAPSVRLMVLDGKVDENRSLAWSSADLFTSMSDNLQETFGLTPVEAMAAALPVVVSDWNGYKDTVRDGIDGFRVPVVAAPPGSGTDLADRHEMNLDGYDLHIGSASQFVAVDVEAAAVAYTRLIGDADLRRRMGESARRRVLQMFDWAPVFTRYVTLWEELAERRRADPSLIEENRRYRRPDRPDPFTAFASFPTTIATPAMRVRLLDGANLTMALDRRTLASVSFAASALPPESLLAAIFDQLANTREADLLSLASALPASSFPALARAIVWLAKMGLASLRSHVPPV